jgi:hypothetical protein
MINLPLAMGSTGGHPLWDEESQEALQFNFLIIALICVPIMLLVKPLALMCCAGSKPSGSGVEEIQDALIDKNDEEHGHDAHDDIGEIFVH